MSDKRHALIVKVLNDEGANSEQGWHSWRCFDKGRYPRSCTCTEDVADEIIKVIDALEKP